jgi:hypothetical protein
MADRATLIDHRQAARAAVGGRQMFAIFGLLIYVVVGLAWLVFTMIRLMAWLMVAAISAASSAITDSTRHRAPQLTIPGRPGRLSLRNAVPPRNAVPVMAAWARGNGGQAFHAVADGLTNLRRQLLLPRPAGREDELAYWQRVLNLATILENLADAAMTSAPQMPDADVQSQWAMALDHAQHGAADLRGAVTGKGCVDFGVAMSELKTAASYVGRLISQVPRSR